MATFVSLFALVKPFAFLSAPLVYQSILEINFRLRFGAPQFFYLIWRRGKRRAISHTRLSLSLSIYSQQTKQIKATFSRILPSISLCVEASAKMAALIS